jgi:hypothetical protein
MFPLKKLIDNLFGKPAALSDNAPINWHANRKQKRVNVSMALAQRAAPKRMKHEKRGAPGRSSKGRKPFRG